MRHERQIAVISLVGYGMIVQNMDIDKHISPVSYEVSFEVLDRDALCMYTSRYESVIVRFGDTCRKMRSQNEQVTKAQLERMIRLRPSVRRICRPLSIAVVLSAALPWHHRTSHHLAPAFFRLIRAMYESLYWPRVLMMGPSGR